MDNKKKYFIAIILFIFIGLMVFTFANPKDNYTELEGSETNTSSTNNSDDSNSNTNEDNLDTDTTSSDNDVNNSNTGSNSNATQTSSNNNNNNNTNDENSTSNGENTTVADNSYELAEIAVKTAEEKIDSESYETALELVNKVTGNKEDLENRLTIVKNEIDAKVLVETLENKVNSSVNKTDLNTARDYRTNEEIIEKVSNLSNDSLKEELQNRLNVLSNLLDDLTSPKVNIEDGTVLAENTILMVEDENEVVIKVNKNNSENSEVVENGTELSEGIYTVTLIDSAFNETTISFIIDTTNPKFNVTSGTHSTEDIEITVDDLSLDYILVYNQDENTTEKVTANELTLKDEATYKLTAYDKTGKTTTVWVAIDKTAPVISGAEDGKTYNKVELKVEDKFLTKVTVNGEVQDGIKTTGKNNEGKTFTKEFTEDGTYTIVATDKVGNESTITFTIDATAPVYSKLGILNVSNYPDKGSLVFAKTGDTIRVIVEFKEKLAQEPTVTINNKEYKCTFRAQSSSDTNFVYMTDYKIKEEDELKEGKVEIKVSNYGDEIGNIGEELTNDNINNKSYPEVIYDKTVPTFNFNNGNIFSEKEIVVTDANFDYMLIYNYATNKTTKIEDNKYLMNDGNTMYKVTAYDKAGNFKEIWIYHDNINPVISGTGKISSKDTELTDGGIYQSVKLTVEDTNLSEVKSIDAEGNENVLCSFKWNDEDKTCELSFTEDGDYTLVATDRAKNSTSIKFTVDKTKPVIGGVVNGGIYNTDVTFTVEDANIGTIHLKKDGNLIKNYKLGTSISEEGVYSVYVSDKAGNKSETITFTIDKTAPTVSVVLDPSGVTRGPVTVTLTANEDIKDIEGWTRVDSKTLTKVYEDNAKDNVVVTDIAGNSMTQFVEVKRIDKITPTFEGIENNAIYNHDVVYKTKSYNKDAEVDFSIVEDSIAKIIIDGKEYAEKEAPKTITEEGTHTIKVIDKAGNESEEITFIIDKTPAKVTAANILVNGDSNEQSIFYATNGDSIYAYVRFNEKLGSNPTFAFINNGKTYTVDVEDVKISEPNANGEYTYSVKYNITESLDMVDGEIELSVTDIKDVAGNVTEDITKPTNGHKVYLDRTIPELTVKDDYVGDLDKKVFSKISFKLHDTLSGIISVNLNEKTLNYSVNAWGDANFNNIKNLLKEGKNTIILYDVAGNASKTYEFTYDVTAPTIEITLNPNGVTRGPVTVTLTANEDIKDIEGWTRVDSKTLTKVYEDNAKDNVVVTDIAGNSMTQFVEVKRIDKITPTFEGIENNAIYNHDVVYKTKSYNKDAEVDFSIVEDSIAKIIIDGKEYAEKEAPKTITEEGTHTIKVIDKAGNESEEITFIIDKTPAKVTAANILVNGDSNEQSIFYATNGDSIYAYVRFNEKLGSNPTFAFINNGKTYTVDVEDVKISEPNANGEYTYSVKYNITESLDMVDGEIELSVTDIKDVAGNVTENITKPTNGHKVYLDRTAPQVSTLRVKGILNGVTSTNYKEITTGYTYQIIWTPTEKLAVLPTVTIVGQENANIKSSSDNNGQYIFSWTIPEDTTIEEGEIKFILSGYEDEAGNKGKDLTNDDIKIGNGQTYVNFSKNLN